MADNEIICTFAVIGGGIAGVSCIESLNFLAPEASKILITESPLIKAITNIVSLGQSLMQFDVEEKSAISLTEANTFLKVIHDTVISIDGINKVIETQNKRFIRYQELCLCTGARPKLISQDSNFVIGIRDTESVIQFADKIRTAKKIVIVGNGGIATEVVHEISGVEVVWVIKDKHISAAFVDPGAAEFFLEKIYEDPSNKNDATPLVKRIRYTTSTDNVKKGPALGPDWHSNISIKGSSLESTKCQIEYECEVKDICFETLDGQCGHAKNWPVYVTLTNGKIIGCDLVVSATGVKPNSSVKGLECLERDEDGGLLVNWKLETSMADIFAAGDVCSAAWNLSKHWFQMRLWTQAYQMGRYVAKSMACSLKGEAFLQDFCFECFTHVTKFFGYKVVLLGLFNGQKLNQDYEILLRVTKRQEYVKLILQNGKMQGAVLIGDTDLEEMCENLILNQLDLSVYGEDLLNPNIDIEDYFD